MFHNTVAWYKGGMLNYTGIPTGACEVELRFRDGGVGTLKTMETSLALGTSAHLDLMAADLASDLARAERVEVLPSLAYVEAITIATGQTSAYATQAVLTFR